MSKVFRPLDCNEKFFLGERFYCTLDNENNLEYMEDTPLSKLQKKELIKTVGLQDYRTRIFLILIPTILQDIEYIVEEHLKEFLEYYINFCKDRKDEDKSKADLRAALSDNSYKRCSEIPNAAAFNNIPFVVTHFNITFDKKNQKLPFSKIRVSSVVGAAINQLPENAGMNRLYSYKEVFDHFAGSKDSDLFKNAKTTMKKIEQIAEEATITANNKFEESMAQIKDDYKIEVLDEEPPTLNEEQPTCFLKNILNSIYNFFLIIFGVIYILCVCFINPQP
ncbi:MAG: hypothetical protein WDZ28_04665 [Simkaniaceae bacterium]